MPQVTANNIRIEYETFGVATGQPLLLIMGLGAQMTRWPVAFCEALAAAGHYVIRFDNRDIGLSERFESAGAPDMKTIGAAMMQGKQPMVAYDLHDMADDAAGLLSAIDIESAHICGASLGGMIAQTLAIQHPSRVKTLTSIMSHTGNRSLPQAKPEAMAVLAAPPVTDRAAVVERAVEVSAVIGSPGYPADATELRDRAGADYDRAFYPIGVARQMAAITVQQDRREALAKLQVPALVIHGKDDALVPVTGGIDTHEALANSTLWVVDGMGHDLPKALWPEFVSRITALTESV